MKRAYAVLREADQPKSMRSPGEYRNNANAYPHWVGIALIWEALSGV